MKTGQSFLGWLQMDAKYVPRNILRGIKNIFKWMPIVWKDADWDHYYITSALKFKIKNTADYIEKHDRYVGCENDVAKMRLCVRLMDKLDDDFYEMEYSDYRDIKFHSVDIGNGLSQLESEVIRNDIQKYIDKYPNDYRRLPDEYKNSDERAAVMMSMMRHQRATKLLFTIIAHNIYNWWD